MGEGSGGEPIIVPEAVYRERLAQFFSGGAEGSAPVTTSVSRSASLDSVEAAFRRDKEARAARAAQSMRAVPVSGLSVVPIQPPDTFPEDDEPDNIPTHETRTKRGHRAGKFVVAAVFVAAGAVGVASGAIKLPTSTGTSHSATTAESKADTPIPGTVAALGPAGFNAQNCNGPEHAVATLTISGRLPLKWLLMSTDNKQITPAKYMDQVAAAMSKPELKTDSGYPEITANSYQYYMNICQVDKKDAVTGSTINTQNLAVTLTPVDASIVVQDKAYMTNLKAGENVTVPPQSFISSNPAVYTDASLKAVNDVATYTQGTAFESQAKGELNLMSDSIGSELASADPKSPINSIMGHTIYDIEELAAKMRLGDSSATLSSAMPAPTVGHTIGNEKAASVAPDDPNNPGFVPTDIQVKFGPPTIATASPTPTPTTTNGGNS